MTQNDAFQPSSITIERAITRANGAVEIYIDHCDAQGNLVRTEKVENDGSVTFEDQNPSWFGKITRGLTRR